MTPEPHNLGYISTLPDSESFNRKKQAIPLLTTDHFSFMFLKNTGVL
ncbi:hypothetical protein D1AOALGA4SA_8952 [Olavius algarvensis Delta 1 endosymbiont]|nr:hypothetical protein D1AOALGA4SA_8952 [Olavius algarvensis Delta 1 endosymbiont]